ncbi:MAG: transcriptional repressor [Caldilineae bacterium]|nr:MAG: transcriptional repressor [Caldilineae bacterium]
MSHDTFDYVSRIREQGYRMTMQRQVVLDAVCEAGGHTTIDAISRRVRSRMPHINRSTIYRTLEFLQAVNLVVSAHIAGRTMYEIAHPCSRHHHLICRGCGAEMELAHEVLAPVFEEITERTGFIVQVEHLVLEGLCPNCLGPEAERVEAGKGGV